ncbi:MAG: glycoside hydrolase family 43 protein [Defluviitaleaceae bacterium]|nr:glycoside hydrolase family 43 protein [Defluviitaleaceae bacterium]
MTYKNPIIPGFYPDPSICKKDGVYYLVTSSFEFFPGVPIFRSTDLLNWRQIGHCLTRKSQLNLENVAASKGIYAATIRYNPHNDLFYMVTTNTHDKQKIGNFFVYTSDPAAEWSDPVFVAQGGIDPSLFFDEDGSAHFISNARDRTVHKSGFLMGQIDLATGEFLTEPQPLWGGIGQNAPEAPHIYRANSYYYQLIAEGGTELNHMVTIARSRQLYGTYEPCPQNPILTHQNQKGHQIQGTGHADFIEDENGNWWAVFLAYRQTHQYFHHLGRETFLAPVDWVDDWPVINGGEPIQLDMQVGRSPILAEMPPIQHLTQEYGTNFESDFRWVYLRNPDESLYRFTQAGLWLTGNQYTLSDVANPAFLGIRQPHLTGSAEFTFSFSPKNNEEAGVSIFYKFDAHIDIFVKRSHGKICLFLRKVVGDIAHIESKIPIDPQNGAESGKIPTITIKICAEPLKYDIYARLSGGQFFYLGQALTRHVSTESHELGFTGVFYAIYATSNGTGKCENAAFFRDCIIRNKD